MVGVSINDIFHNIAPPWPYTNSH